MLSFSARPRAGALAQGVPGVAIRVFGSVIATMAVLLGLAKTLHPVNIPPVGAKSTNPSYLAGEP
jgi:hypothetical protein